MALQLYLDLLSQPCRSVYIFAKKNNIPFDFKQISLAEGNHKTEEYEKITATTKVPAMQDGDFCLAESIAILLYLAEKFQTPSHWYPVDLRQRARVNEYLSWQHSTMRRHGTRVFWLQIVIPRILGEETPKEKIDSALEDLNESLRVFEAKFLQDRPFIAGDHLSLADLVAIVEIMQPVACDVEVFQGRPKLSAWRDRVRDAIGTELFDEAHQSVMGAQEKIKMVDVDKLQGLRPRIKVFL
ncbi:glutathione S-transferase theta-1b [Nelusetta ayraudi]|uniref:glutathione S-transferase theta-1b n=1 Tax=Nelusetta ayraudi TaxID=303726 RepID=UPI003F6E499D